MTLFDVLSRQRRVVFLATALLSVAGVWTAFRLPSAIYPELLFPRIKIVAQGSTLGARQVVFSITRPLEEAVSIVPGVTRVQSHSIRGAGEVAVTFERARDADRKSTRLNSSHITISYAVFCLKKKKKH